MPLYEYSCRSCHRRFERLEHVSAQRNAACPDCGDSADRLVAPPALRFKGAGWYVTDYGQQRGSATETTT